jgi:signal transduction histidine kinase
MFVWFGSALSALLLATVALQALVWSASVGPLLFDSHVGEVVSSIAFLGWSAVGVLVVARRPGNRVGLILLIAGLAGQTWVLLAYYAAFALIVRPGSLPAAELAAWSLTWLPTLAFGLAFAFLFLLFPDGRLPSPRWRPFAWFAGVAVAFICLTWATEPGPLFGDFDIVDNPIGIQIVGQIDSGVGWMLFVLAMLGSIVAPVARIRRTSGVQRQQLKWFTYTGAMVALTWVATTIGSDAGPPFTTIASLTGPVAISAVPLTVFIAIFKHNLYDIDVVISRTIVVGALAILVTGGYVVVVAVVGAAIGRVGGTGLGLLVLATALVAVAFQPARSWIQRLANRLVYGRRATPYEVLTVLARRMGDAYAAEDLLPHLAKTVAEGTGASRVEVWLLADRQLRRMACWPATPQQPAPLPADGDPPTVPEASEVTMVRHQGLLVGALAVTLAPGRALSAVEQRLLADLAAQVGVALDNLRLIEELRASRLRIVAAQDEERRRIERDIHDGVQQRLVSLSLALRMAATGPTSTAAATILDKAAEEARAALVELRRLARGIHPAIVSEGGLVAALESLAERSAVPTEVVSVPLERLPPPVEVTVYYLVAEALANTAKHAQATLVEIKVDRFDGRVRVIVADNGVGGAKPDTESGLTGLADRVAALNGVFEVDSPPGQGTRLWVEIPCASS